MDSCLNCAEHVAELLLSAPDGTMLCRSCAAATILPPRTLLWTKVDPAGPGLAAFQLAGDAGMDLAAAHTVRLDPGEVQDIPTNVRVQLPPDCWGEIRPRSSIARRGLQTESGIIDSCFTGELFALVRNLNMTRRHRSAVADTFGRVTIEQGERIAQIILHQRVSVHLLQVPELEHDPRRGAAGFGSTNQTEEVMPK